MVVVVVVVAAAAVAGAAAVVVYLVAMLLFLLLSLLVFLQTQWLAKFQIRGPKEDVEYALRRLVISPLRQVDRCNCLREGIQSRVFSSLKLGRCWHGASSVFAQNTSTKAHLCDVVP